MNATPCIDIRGLEKRYPRFTLGPIDLTIPSGTIYGLIGPNGAGKTTLIDQIFGMGAPDAGMIRVCGLNHALDEVAVKQKAAYVGPDLNFVVWGKVSKAIRFIRGFRPTWDDDYADKLMESLGINGSDKIATLSFGGRTKLSLLLALAWRPQVLVLDEPTTGLDAHSKKAIFTELLSIVKDEARTVLISSHQINDLERFADCIGVLNKGQMLLHGETADLVERYVQVEFSAAETAEIDTMPGLVVQDQEGGRWQAVLDTRTSSLQNLVSRGATAVHSQALTLEELFLALTK